MDTKEKLIETTRELLWQHGYTGMSPKDIQKLSGVGQGSMYHHFKGKSDLVLESIRKNAEDMKTITGEKLAQGTTALEKIKSFLLRPRNVMRGCRIGGLTQDSFILGDPEMHRILGESFEWLHQRLMEIIQEGQKNGEFDGSLNAEEVASSISATLQGGYVLAKAAASEEPFFQAVKGIISLLEKMKK